MHILFFQKGVDNFEIEHKTCFPTLNAIFEFLEQFTIVNACMLTFTFYTDILLKEYEYF